MEKSLNPTKSAKPMVIGKTFRLFDFHIFNENPDAPTNNSSSESDNSSCDEEQHTKRKTEDDLQFQIQMFGINETGETCSIIVPDFYPYFYVKVADHWTDETVASYGRHLRETVGKYYANSIRKIELVKRNKLYGFSAGKQSNFVYLEFKNIPAFNKVKNLWYDYVSGEKKRKRVEFKKVELELYESDIPPLLRYFHIQNISPSGWVYIPTARTSRPPQKTTTCKYEYICKKSFIRPLPNKETRVPYKICSFDIEASSSHGDFPIPIKTYKRLVMNMIDSFQKHSKQITTVEKANDIITKIILTAFGFTKFQDIDLVYPKQNCNREKIVKLIDIITTSPIDNAKKMNTEENNGYLLTIEQLFQKMSEPKYMQNNLPANNDDDNDDGGEGGDEYGNNNCDDITDDVVVTKKNNTIKKEKKEMVREIKSPTIVDILMNETAYTREEKIQYINETMTLLFPRLEGDKTTFIGSTFMRYGEPEPYLNHCFVLNDCDQIDGCIIETVKTEKDLLLKWVDLMQKENPDVIIGYNIFGFDYEFMFRRAQENNCVREFLLLSRRNNELCGKYNEKTDDYSIENTKIVLASGEYDLHYLKIAGRLQIDMYTYFRRDFNLPSYKLDSVAGQYIGDTIKLIQTKTDDKYGDVTELYSQNLTGLHTNDYIHIETIGFTTDYIENGKKFHVVGIDKKREVMENGEEITYYNVIIIEGKWNIDTSKKMRWGVAKDDVTPQDIFKLSNGNATDRATVAKYCIQDCNLVHHLMNKIDVITGYVEMSRICSVPISFLVFRGQGIKLTSYVAKKCREYNTLMPDLEKSYSDGGYEGAIVLAPKCSMYMDNPVACVDYASLYPSSMISQNYSHDSKVWTKEYDLSGKLIKETGEIDKYGTYIYDNLPEFQYIDTEFDTFRYIRKTPTSKAVKVKSGYMVCRWAQLPDNKKSIMPSILEELLKARSQTRKMIKTEKDPFMQNILDKRQLGYKVTANSLYGQCGSRTSTFYEKDVAASTTATGRKMIIYAKTIIEDVYGNLKYDSKCHGPVLTKAEYVYGDSVSENTPVFIRHKLDAKLAKIVTIREVSEMFDNNWKTCEEEGKETKEYCECICNGGYYAETWTEKGWTKIQRIIRHKLAPHKKMVRVCTPTGIVEVTDDHSLLRPDGKEISPKNAKIGMSLLHHSFPENVACYYDKHFCKNLIENHDGIYHRQYGMFSNQINAMQWYYKVLSMGYLATIKTLMYRGRIHYQIDVQDEIVLPHNIISMEEIPYSGYVYDLTTDNHHFAAGIGNIIVHNTDSVFFTFNLQDTKTNQKITGKKALEITIEIAQDVAHLCTKYLKPPMELTYEKTLMPFILLSKKRYVGMLYENEPVKGKLKYMGLSLKRRDSCDYLKDTYGTILDILMRENKLATTTTSDINGLANSNVINIKNAIDFLEKSLQNLIDGKVSMDKLEITKALRSDYKNPNQIAHKVLADRIGERDPGNKPKPGDRMKFVFVCNNNRGALQGEKIETPEFILSNDLKVDYVYYITNQLMKPLQQLFGLALVQIWEYQKKTATIKTYEKDIAKIKMESNDNLEEFAKKKEKYCSKKAEILLFKKFLDKINNEKNKIQTLSSFGFGYM
jgi:DNA polymerase elongation subunit (family B)